MAVTELTGFKTDTRTSGRSLHNHRVVFLAWRLMLTHRYRVLFRADISC